MSNGHISNERSPLLKKQQRQQGDDEAFLAVDEDDVERQRWQQHTTTTTTNEEERDVDHAADVQVDPELYKQLKWFAPFCGIGVWLAAVDQTIIVSSYGKIGSELDALNLTSWIATGYLLSLTSFQPLYGKLSDIFGRKGCLLFAYVVFGLGGLFCGLSRTMGQMIAARVFQGIGGGGMTVVCNIIVNDLVPIKDRGLWNGVANIVYAGGAASGAPLGGVFSDTVGWRWMFILQAPLALVALVAVAVTMKLPPLPKQDLRLKLGRIDFLGAITLVLAVFCLLFGMDRGSNQSWTVAASYGPLIAAVVLFAAFFYVESHVAAEPFAPGHIIFTRTMAAAYSCCFFAFASWLSVLYYLPLYFQAADGVSATTAGQRLLPAIATLVIGSVGAGYLMRRTGRYYRLTVVAYVALVAGIVPIFLFSGFLSHNLPAVLAGTVVSGTGNGAAVTSVLIALVAAASPKDHAVVTACSYLFRGLGSTVGIALSATVVQSALRSELRRSLGEGPLAEDIERRVRRSLDAVWDLDPDTRRLVRDAYAKAVSGCYVLCFAFAVAALIASCFIRERRLKT